MNLVKIALMVNLPGQKLSHKGKKIIAPRGFHKALNLQQDKKL